MDNANQMIIKNIICKDYTEYHMYASTILSKKFFKSLVM